MSDKFNILTSNIIRFVAGERPTADKFNAMNLYYTRAVDNICRAIGDMHDRSAHEPLSPQWNPNETGLEGRPLDIANLARLIGPASNLNPKMFTGNSREIVETISKSSLLESKEFELKYEIKLHTLFFPMLKIERFDSSDELIELINPLVYPGIYSILFKRLLTFRSDLLLNTGEYLKVTYTTKGSGQGGINYYGASFNTIPDPNEESGLTDNEISDISAEDNGWLYKVDFSNRKIKNQQSGTHELYKSDVTSEDEFNSNTTYSLPEWWVEKFNLNGLIQSLPSGLIYLKNIETGEIYLTAEYAASDISTLYIRSASLCLEDEHRLTLVGTDITTSIDDLRNKMFNHRHNGSFGEPFIRIQDLVGKFVTGEFGPSSIPGNEFPMYLHRNGYQTDTNVLNGNNAMLGNIFMGNIGFDGISNTEIESGTSHAIKFGSQQTLISKFLGSLVISNLDGNLDGVTNRTSINTGHTLILSQKHLDANTVEDATFDQKNYTSDSSVNTTINSDNETHLKINDNDVIVLKKNDDATNVSGNNIIGINNEGYYLGENNEREWNSNDRTVLSRHENIEKKDYTIINFEPSTRAASVAPCGVVTQYENDTGLNQNFLFVTNHASITVDGTLSVNVASHTQDTKGRSFHDLEIPYENFILNYSKKITKNFNDLDAEDYGIWSQQYEETDDGSFNGEMILGDMPGAGRSGVDFCFGGVGYSGEGREKSGGQYLAGSKFINNSSARPGYTHRFEHYVNEEYWWNLDSYSKILLEVGVNWTEGSDTKGNKQYEYVSIPSVDNFRLFQCDYFAQLNHVGLDYSERLLEEVKYTWGVRATYTPGDGGEQKISWLVGPPFGATNESIIGIEYDYEWSLSDQTDSEFDLKLTINPRRLFQQTAAEVIAEKDRYTFHTYWRPYNYTRPSLKPTEIIHTPRRLTDSDETYEYTDYSYALLCADYEEDKQPEWIQASEERECVDQRIPVGADIALLAENRELKNSNFKKLCPISLGVLNEDYHPDPTLGNVLASFQIHPDDEETHYCRAASVGGSKQSIGIARNVSFEPGVSSKNFIINTNGGEGSPSNSTFLFEEYYAAIAHHDIAYDPDRTYQTYRRGINCLEKPNFLLFYQLGNKDNTTFSLNFNGRDGMADAEILNGYLKNKVINLSTLINKRFSEEIWEKSFAPKYRAVSALDSKTRADLVARWSLYYGSSSEIKARLNVQKNWLNFQRPRNEGNPVMVNGVGSAGGETLSDYFMQHILQCMFAAVYDAGSADYQRMPFTFSGAKFQTPYFRNIFFDVNLDITETYNEYTDHLDIDVKCNYIIKHHKLRNPTGPTDRQILWSKKGILQNSIDSPYRRIDSDGEWWTLGI